MEEKAQMDPNNPPLARTLEDEANFLRGEIKALEKRCRDVKDKIAALADLLFLVLLTLKLLGKITLSWFWVTAPLWGGLAIFLAILAVLGVAALVAVILKR